MTYIQPKTAEEVLQAFREGREVRYSGEENEDPEPRRSFELSIHALIHNLDRIRIAAPRLECWAVVLACGAGEVLYSEEADAVNLQQRNPGSRIVRMVEAPEETK